MCPTHDPGQDKSSSVCRFARLFESSSLLDNIHDILNSPEAGHAPNREELMLNFQTLINLQTIVTEEVGDGVQLYSGAIALSNAALLVAFEHGTKVPHMPGETDECNTCANSSLISVLSSMTSSIGIFKLGMQVIDFNLFQPLVAFSVYKAASIVTMRLLSGDCDILDEGLNVLRSLRWLLKEVGKRWLCC
ncbi:hypothetical protein LSUE1_G000522, partial [Lachnellula suecica]